VVIIYADNTVDPPAKMWERCETDCCPTREAAEAECQRRNNESKR